MASPDHDWISFLPGDTEALRFSTLLPMIPSPDCLGVSRGLFSYKKFIFPPAFPIYFPLEKWYTEYRKPAGLSGGREVSV